MTLKKTAPVLAAAALTTTFAFSAPANAHPHHSNDQQYREYQYRTHSHNNHNRRTHPNYNHRRDKDIDTGDVLIGIGIGIILNEVFEDSARDNHRHYPRRGHHHRRPAYTGIIKGYPVVGTSFNGQPIVRGYDGQLCTVFYPHSPRHTKFQDIHADGQNVRYYHYGSPHSRTCRRGPR